MAFPDVRPAATISKGGDRALGEAGVDGSDRLLRQPDRLLCEVAGDHTGSLVLGRVPRYPNAMREADVLPQQRRKPWIRESRDVRPHLETVPPKYRVATHHERVLREVERQVVLTAP